VLVSTLTEPSKRKRLSSVCALRYTVEADGEELAEIAGLVSSGKVKPRVQGTFALGGSRCFGFSRAGAFGRQDCLESRIRDGLSTHVDDRCAFYSGMAFLIGEVKFNHTFMRCVITAANDLRVN
jgi:hypothetical protein